MFREDIPEWHEWLTSLVQTFEPLPETRKDDHYTKLETVIPPETTDEDVAVILPLIIQDYKDAVPMRKAFSDSSSVIAADKESIIQSLRYLKIEQHDGSEDIEPRIKPAMALINEETP